MGLLPPPVPSGPTTIDPPESTMCQPATCQTCGKTTWAGCGQHVDQVLRAVPVDERCTCADDRDQPTQKKGLLARILGR